ncbi:MAG: hypothetical protein AM326_07400 [Candidatus Thorarchaeota archaeon SMTZ-45]|nr:MAG: hypothetical protein AM325_12140 [Candidatus Thorarchaeota archaeon SMTZ1-45]KXH76298.1 MAG: hypothetical protein AM326_07400 [Candidatus Thorarchaeota archaeon SMTZ-45]
MVGIAGLLVANEEKDSELMLQKMSEAIKHRRCETVHTVEHNDSKCMILGSRSVQSLDDELMIIDRNEDLIQSETKYNTESFPNLFGEVGVVVNNSGVNLFRSLDGTRTLYHGILKNRFVFATEKKSLWNIGLASVYTLQPGQSLIRTWNGKTDTKRFTSLEKPPRKDISREETLVILEKTLRSVFEKLRNDTVCGVLFSGGVDSSLAAVQVAKRCKNTFLFTSCLKDAHDKLAATKAAELLGVQLHLVEMNSQSIWNILPELIYSIETSNQMDVEIAIPFYLAAKKASEKGCTTIVSGQGPDELFAGYAKHVQTYIEEGPDVLMHHLWHALLITHEANIERDDRAIAAHGVESFFPYLDNQFVRTSLSVPIEWKIDLARQPQRKIIFRELAQIMGVPEEIAFAPKSATQYSSGSSKVLLDAIIEHIDEFKVMSKKKASREVQTILNEIAYALNMPNIRSNEKPRGLEFDTVSRFLEKRKSSSSSNQR